ncbi:hypothetical protein CC2G_009534 [Coprinopsis cinerea AmutBmut pab1-1]|nr:hypothetical protein CC2G_009534 [Coprinopsis cinerea AmutBmut pab1-1]
MKVPRADLAFVFELLFDVRELKWEHATPLSKGTPVLSVASHTEAMTAAESAAVEIALLAPGGGAAATA